MAAGTPPSPRRLYLGVGQGSSSAISAASDDVMVCSGAGSQAVAAAMASQHVSSLLDTWAVSATA
jgi:hypothetical protein